MKRIIIISTNKKSTAIFPILAAINNNKNRLKIFSANKKLIKLMREKTISARKIKKIFPSRLWITTLIFILFWPLILISVFLFIIYLKFIAKTDILILICPPEKYLLTSLASIFKIKIIWFEFPENWINSKNLNKKSNKTRKKFKRPKILKRIFLFCGRQAFFVIFDNLTKQKLEKIGVKKEKIFLTRPGIVWQEYGRQKNIFNKLAENKQGWNKQQKFFTVGAVLTKDSAPNIKTILQAAKSCLSSIPNFQLIIIGENEEKKNLSWLSKQMEINNAVWFVGAKSQLKKWLENLSIFIISGQNYSLKNSQIAIEALSAGLPIIAPENEGWEEIVQSGKNGYFTNINNKESLSQTIIKIEQNHILIKKMSQASHDLAQEKFSLEKNIIPLLDLLE